MRNRRAPHDGSIAVPGRLGIRHARDIIECLAASSPRSGRPEAFWRGVQAMRSAQGGRAPISARYAPNRASIGIEGALQVVNPHPELFAGRMIVDRKSVV